MAAWAGGAAVTQVRRSSFPLSFSRRSRNNQRIALQYWLLTALESAPQGCSSGYKKSWEKKSRGRKAQVPPSRSTNRSCLPFWQRPDCSSPPFATHTSTCGSVTRLSVDRLKEQHDFGLACWDLTAMLQRLSTYKLPQSAIFWSAEITDRCSSEEFNVYLLFTVNYYLPNAAAELKD